MGGAGCCGLCLELMILVCVCGCVGGVVEGVHVDWPNTVPHHGPLWRE